MPKIEEVFTKGYVTTRKKHSLNLCKFIKTYSGYVYELFCSYISLNFDLVFVKYFVLLTIDRSAFFADGTFMSTISFMLCFLFKLIERLGRHLVPTLFCLCRLLILDFLLETAIGCTLIFVRFLLKNVVPKL